MLNPMRHRTHGFTLIELMVAISLFAVLVVLGLPSFMSWIRNNQLRTVADALQNGLRLAQSEALRQNQAVVFAFTNVVPSLTAASAAAAGGKNWEIWSIPQFGASAAFVEGGALSNLASTVNVTVASGQAAICFNANGRLMASTSTGVGASCVAGPQTFTIAQATSNTNDRQFRVLVSLAGQVRMCDKSLQDQSATSAAGCPTGTP